MRCGTRRRTLSVWERFSVLGVLGRMLPGCIRGPGVILAIRGQTVHPDYMAVAKDLAQEISFLEYRLAVLGGWPDSEQRSALMDATMARLRILRNSEGISPRESRCSIGD